MTSSLTASTTIEDLFMRRTFQDSAGYPRILDIHDLKSARLQSLLEVGVAKLLAAMLGDMGVSTLRLIKIMTQFSSLFEHQTSHAACFNA
jgi:hypothetical protein